MAGFKHALNAAPAYTYYFTWQTGLGRSHGAACVNYARLLALKRQYDPTNLLRRKSTSIREFETT